MNKIVKQNLKRIATELLDRFDYSEVDDLLLDIEEIEKALTPPTADEIVKELNEKLKVYSEFKRCDYIDTTNIFRIYYKDTAYLEIFTHNKMISIPIILPLETSHKITSFFKHKEANNGKT